MSGRTEPPLDRSTDLSVDRLPDQAADPSASRPAAVAETPVEVAVRMAPQLRLIQVGTVSALLAAGTAATALVDYPGDAGSDIWFPVGALVGAVVLVAICVGQWIIWRRALAAWRADLTFGDDRVVRGSWWLHVVSYPVLLIALYLSIEASALGGFSALPGFVLGIGVLLLLIAQVTAAVQYLRIDGGSGTIPNHLRTLMAKIQSQR